MLRIFVFMTEQIKKIWDLQIFMGLLSQERLTHPPFCLYSTLLGQADDD